MGSRARGKVLLALREEEDGGIAAHPPRASGVSTSAARRVRASVCAHSLSCPLLHKPQSDQPASGVSRRAARQHAHDAGAEAAGRRLPHLARAVGCALRHPPALCVEVLRWQRARRCQRGALGSGGIEDARRRQRRGQLRNARRRSKRRRSSRGAGATQRRRPRGDSRGRFGRRGQQGLGRNGQLEPA